jgi:hypothetical protein
MEHRWGNRIALELPVMIVTTAGRRGFGILRNFSSSGGYVETTLPLAPLAPLEVELHGPSGIADQDRRLTGYVVRRDRCGLGIEWSDALAMPAAAVLPRQAPARLTA